MFKKITPVFLAVSALLVVFFGFGLLSSSVLADQDTLGLKNDKVSPEVQEIESKGLVPCTIETCTFCSLLKLMERINIYLLGIAFAVAMFFVVLSGFIYIVSIGDSGTMGFAKEGLKYAIGGFVICLFSFLAIHTVYLVTGYKNPNGGNWWEIQCNSGTPQSLLDLDSKKKISKAYANEVSPDSVGGRDNPISLDDLVKEKLASLPEGKYFFMHGLGGQSLKETAGQLLALTEKASSAKRDLTVALPRQDINGNLVGQKSVNLVEFLDSLDSSIFADEKSTKKNEVGANLKEDKFFELALSLLDESSSVELPLVATEKGAEVPKFNENWVGLDWTGITSDGNAPKFKANSTVENGLSFQEGDGPFFYDPERYEGNIPENQTHVQVNLKEDGSLDTSDPLSVLNVAPGVSRDTLNNYLSEMIRVLMTTQKKYSDLGKEKDFIYGLTDLLSRSMSEKALKSNTDTPEKKTADKETTQGDESDEAAVDKNANTNSATDGKTITDSNYNRDSEMTGGSGILPDKIAQNSNQKNKLTDKQIEDMIKKIMQQNDSGSNGSSSGSNGNNSSSSGNGSNSSNGNNTTSGNNWSSTSVSSSGYKLNEDEKKRLENMIEEYKKELNLNVPKEFVMCIIQRESAFKPEALNDRGEYSIGLMQINKRSKTDQAALSGLKKYGPNLYEKLKKHHGSDAKILDTSSMQSKNDPQGEKGMTNIALGMAYLKKINAENRRGGALSGADDWDNLAAGYNCGPAGCKGGRTDYSTAVTACTRTMMAKNQQSGTKSAGQ